MVTDFKQITSLENSQSDSRNTASYTVKQSDIDDGKVVNTARGESDLERMTEQEIQDLALEMDAALVKNYEEYRDTDRTRRFGQEIWVGLLWLVLIVAFGELFLIQHLQVIILNNLH